MSLKIAEYRDEQRYERQRFHQAAQAVKKLVDVVTATLRGPRLIWPLPPQPQRPTYAKLRAVSRRDLRASRKDQRLARQRSQAFARTRR